MNPKPSIVATCFDRYLGTTVLELAHGQRHAPGLFVAVLPDRSRRKPDDGEGLSLRRLRPINFDGQWIVVSVSIDGLEHICTSIALEALCAIDWQDEINMGLQVRCENA